MPPDEEIPKKITQDQYDKLMREMWEMKQKTALLNTLLIDQKDIDELYKQNQKIMQELKILRKMFIKIGTALFKKSTESKGSEGGKPLP